MYDRDLFTRLLYLILYLKNLKYVKRSPMKLMSQSFTFFLYRSAKCILKMASLICTVDWSLLGLFYSDLCGTTAGSPSTSLDIYYSENSTCVLKYYTGLLNVVASLYPSLCYPIRFLTSLLFVQVTNQMHDKIVIPCSVWKLHEFLRTTV